MKLSELRKCDHCGGVLAPQGLFYVVRVSLAMVRPAAVNQVAGLMQLWGDSSDWGLLLAETMAPDGADAVTVAGDKEPSLMAEFLVCQTCFTMKPVDLALMQERRAGAASA